MSTASTFSFPILKNAEIIACTAELGCPVTLPMLQEPSEEALLPVLRKLVELLKGTSTDDLKSLDFRGLSLLSFPELHEESVCAIGEMRELLVLAKATGVHDITLTDITNPERQRTRRLLSALINFAKFREDKLEFFSSFTTASASLIELRASLESTLDALTAQKEQLERAHPEVEKRTAEVREDVEAKKAAINALVAQQTSVREEIKTVKSASAHVAQALQNINSQLQSLQEENDRLKSQIVHEPEVLQASLVAKAEAMATGRGELNAQQSKLKTLTAKLNAIVKAEEKLTQRNEQLRQVQAEQANVTKSRKQNADTAAAIARTEQNITDLSQQENTLKQHLQSAQEKLFALHAQFEQKRTTTAAAMEQVESEKAQLEQLLHAKKSQAEHNEHLLALKKQQMNNLNNEHAKTMQNLRTKYEQLKQTVEQYHEKLAATMANQENIPPA